MAKFRGLDNNNDWKFGRGKNDYVDGIEAVKLDIKTRIQSWKNDCFFAMDEGIDWTKLLDKGNAENLENEIRLTILKTSGVFRLNSFSFSQVDRTFSVSYNVTTIYSQSFSDSVEVA